MLKYQQRVYWHMRKMVVDHDDADDLAPTKRDNKPPSTRNLSNFSLALHHLPLAPSMNQLVPDNFYCGNALKKM